jgi:hypothetical protein
MSVFTNPASGAPEHAAAYTAAILELLGDRDPFDVLAATPDLLARRLLDVDVAEIRRPESEGKWSVGDVLQHLADSDLVFGYRARMVLAHDRPQLTGYDQDRWADRLRYRDSNHHEALAMFAMLRGANLKLLRGCSAEELDRVSVHAERGEESLGHMIRLYAGHDLLHIRQIDRILSRR